jgi:uracil-DNA glycosylase
LSAALVIGQYAHAYFLGEGRKRILTNTAQAWRDYAPAAPPLPHPSPRKVGWFKHNPWFEGEVVPALRKLLAYPSLSTSTR